MGVIGTIFGQHDEGTLEQLKDVASRAVVASLMSDGHKGYVMPIGGVAGYDNKVSVVGVGFDIACGNAAIKTDMTLERLTNGALTKDDLKANPERVRTNPLLNQLATDIFNTISFGLDRSQRNTNDDAPTDDPLFHDSAWWAIPQKIKTDLRTGYRDALIQKARDQLGTVGSGNHYVDVFVGTDDHLWVGVHFGSRGLGHTIATAYNAIAQGGEWGDRAKEQEVLLDLTSPSGEEYWALMNLAGKYAYLGREWVARKVASLFGGNETRLVHNHHNFAWKEQHAVPVQKGGTRTFEDVLKRPLENYEQRELIVIRKGATPAFPGQEGFVGGSMGDDSVILSGRFASQLGWEERVLQMAAMYSTVHGAGRVMSRNAAAGVRYRGGKKAGQLKKDPQGNVINAGLISQQMMDRWVRERGVILRGGGRDEAPQAYRRLTNVLEAQGPTISVQETLSPIIVCMAGENEFDPYKD